MKQSWIRRACALLIALILGSALIPVQASAQYYINEDQRDYLAGLRAAAIHGDRSRIPDLIKALHEDHGSYHAVALHGLKRLHALEALADVEAYIQEHGGEDKVPDAVSARAVLLAPVAAGTVQTAPKNHTTLAAVPNTVRLQAAQGQVTHLLQSLHFDTDTLLAGLEAYHRAGLRQEIGWTPAVYALNNLADLAYYGDYAACMKLPEFKIFAQIEAPGASLKMKYAAVPPALRYKRLVDDMANRGKTETQTGVEGMTLQLAIDEGLPASRYAAAKLMEMDKHRAEYAVTQNGVTYVHAGFSSLFRLIAGVGDKAQLPVIEHFLNDHDKWIRYYATQVHGQVKKGWRSSWAVGF